MCSRESNHAEGAGGFESCPSGEFERLAQRLRARRHRRVVLRTLGAAAACAGAGAVVWEWVGTGGGSDPTIAGIPCSQVRALAASYLRGELPEDQMRQISLHLGQCPRCRELLRSMSQRS
jgi:anti-sigma factor RsiW